MLKEIYCDLLKTKIRPNGTINFKKGLNVILGSKVGANSIGKSTTLLIIDFVFGGNTYVSSNAVKELGNHIIYFTFRFNNTDYKFARSTESPGEIIWIEKKKRVTKIDDFIDWLSANYSMNLPGLQFRNTFSRFFRIYGKNNYSETNPLQVRGGSESQKDAIRILIVLFNKYEEIKAFEEQLKLAENRINAFKSARKYDRL